MKLLKYLTPHRGHLYEENIVLHDYKTIYMPIPKVACTSMKKYICELLNIPPDDPDNPTTGIHHHNYPYVNKNAIYSKYSDYYVFGFVRNPFDRLVSCYSNKISKDPNRTDDWFQDGVARIFRKYRHIMWGGMSFDEFAAAVAIIPDKKAEKHFRSQWTTLHDNKGRFLPDLTGKFENLNEDLATIVNSTGLPGEKLPHLMKSTHRNYQDFYSAKTKDLIAKRYEKDLQLFSYEF